ncbi:MAG: hypothetical protein OXB95_00380 [Rhodobacteraceae bacterium]|nr:hypothetical protein [Paracoccaceae bacterium]
MSLRRDLPKSQAARACRAIETSRQERRAWRRQHICPVSTAADIELGVTLGGATLKMTYGNSSTVKTEVVTAAVAESYETSEIVRYYDIRIKNPLSEEKPATGTDGRTAVQMVEFVGWHSTDRPSLVADTFFDKVDTVADVDSDDDPTTPDASDGIQFMADLTDDGTDNPTTVTRLMADNGAVSWVNDADATATDDVLVPDADNPDAEVNQQIAAAMKAYNKRLKEEQETYITSLMPQNRATRTSERTIFDGTEKGKAAAEAALDTLDCDGDGITAKMAKDAIKAKVSATAVSEAETNLEDEMEACPRDDAIRKVAETVEKYIPGTPAVTKDVTDDQDEWAIGVGFAAGGVDIGVGYDSNKLVNMGVASSIGGISMALYYEKPKDTMDAEDNVVTMGPNMGINVGMSVAEGTSVNVGVSRGYDSDGMSQRGVGIGMSHDLGGGASFKFGAGRVKGKTAADAGISMSF